MNERPKDPAAVALGKRRIAKMTPEEQRAFHKKGSDALRRRPPLERRLTAQKSALTRRMGPAWMRKQISQAEPSATPTPAPAVDPADALDLAKQLNTADDEILRVLAEQLRGRYGR